MDKRLTGKILIAIGLLWFVVLPFAPKAYLPTAGWPFGVINGAITSLILNGWLLIKNKKSPAKLL